MLRSALLLCCLVLFSCHNANQENSSSEKKGSANSLSQFSIHRDLLNKFQISYPSSWDTSGKDSNAVFIAFEINDDSLDSFNEGMNISVTPSAGMNLEELANYNEKLAAQNYPGSEIKKVKSSNSNGLEYYLIELTIHEQGVNLICYSVMFERLNQLYTTTFIIEAGNLSQYKEIVGTMIDSFNFID